MNKFLIIIIWISMSASSKVINWDRYKHLGDVCQLHDNKQPGECKFVRDCSDYFKNTTKITICGFDRLDSIICCPETESKDVVLINEYIELTSECIVKGTNESGFHKLIKHCPRIEKEVKNGAPFPRICDYEICRDLVCCPSGELRRKNEVCYLYDDASYTIYIRIIHEEYCTINEVLGIFKRKDDCNSTEAVTNQRVCDYDFCKDIVCCPITDVIPEFTNALESKTFVNIIGGSCVDEITGEAGICKPEDRCHDYTPLIDTRDYTSCGYEFCIELVCCPTPKFTSRSLQACEIYKEAVFESVRKIKDLRATVDPILICKIALPAGGNKALPRQFPNVAALGYQKNNESIVWNCGGSLISNRFVLTAAHCVNSEEFGAVRFVRLGALTIDQPDTLGCPEEFQVIERIVHPSYNKSERYNDIALIKLDRIVPFTTHIRPACLPTVANLPDLPEYEWFTAMGWGQTGFAGPRTDWLVFVKLQEFNNTYCNEFFKDASRLPLGIVEETQFCAGSKFSIDDTCPGDSGGPLQITRNYEMAEVLGITSFGNACGFKNSPSVYTRVFPYVKWIEGIVWK